MCSIARYGGPRRWSAFRVGSAQLKYPHALNGSAEAPRNDVIPLRHWGSRSQPVGAWHRVGMTSTCLPSAGGTTRRGAETLIIAQAGVERRRGRWHVPADQDYEARPLRLTAG